MRVATCRRKDEKQHFKMMASGIGSIKMKVRKDLCLTAETMEQWEKTRQAERGWGTTMDVQETQEAESAEGAKSADSKEDSEEGSDSEEGDEEGADSEEDSLIETEAAQGAELRNKDLEKERNKAQRKKVTHYARKRGLTKERKNTQRKAQYTRKDSLLAISQHDFGVQSLTETGRETRVLSRKADEKTVKKKQKPLGINDEEK